MEKIQLQSVYRYQRASNILYELLSERDSKTSISHRRMPTWMEHKRFIASKPYRSWSLIVRNGEVVGSVYLSKQNEIGLFIFKKHCGEGYGRRALHILFKKYSKETHFLANVNPANGRSIRFFKKLGFGHIQNTYELRKRG